MEPYPPDLRRPAGLRMWAGDGAHAHQACVCAVLKVAFAQTVGESFSKGRPQAWTGEMVEVVA